jgi:hypothetical protein
MLGGKGQGGAGAVGVRVQVVGHDFGPDREQRRHAQHGFVQEGACGGVVEVANVWRQEGLVAARQAHAALLLRAKGQHHRSGVGQADRRRRIAPAAAHELGLTGQ